MAEIATPTDASAKPEPHGKARRNQKKRDAKKAKKAGKVKGETEMGSENGKNGRDGSISIVHSAHLD